MQSQISTLLAVCALALAATGCGSDEPTTGNEPDPNDKRAVALDCFTNGEGLDAELLGDHSIQVDGPDGPRVDFFLTFGEAESRQFKGEAQGAEQVGTSLLYVKNGSDEVLEAMENCLG